MAYVKTEHCKTSDHVINLEKYITKSDKTLNGKLVYYNELVNTEKSFLKNCNETAEYFNIGSDKRPRLAYQIIQSFKRSENCSPEQVFEMTKEFAEQAFPGYKYIVSTHNDADNIINSHIVLDPINTITGRKFNDNLATVSCLREISDTICKRYGLTTIANPKYEYKGIDKTTYEMYKQSKSWKVQLAKDMLQLLNDNSISSIDEFYIKLAQKGYDIKFTENNVSILKFGEKKRIRIDTLAKQFGDKLSKENIERHYNGEKVRQKGNYVKSVPFNENNTEFQKIQRYYFSSSSKRKETNSINKVLYKVFRARTGSVGKIFRCLSLMKNAHRKNNYVKPSAHKKPKIAWVTSDTVIRIGNIPSKLMYQSYGEICTATITVEELNKLQRANFFWCGTMSNNKINIVFKKNNLDLYATLLDKTSEQIKKEVSERIGNIPNKTMYQSYGEIQNLQITAGELEILKKQTQFLWSGTIKNGKIYINFKEADIELCAAMLHKRVSDIKSASEIREEKIMRNVFKADADENKKVYRMRGTATDVFTLKRSGISFSYTRYGENYAILYYDKDIVAVCNACGRDPTKEHQRQIVNEYKKNYSQLKAAAASSGSRLQYRVIDGAGLERLKNADFKVAVFEKSDGRYNCCFESQDIDKWERLMTTSGRYQRR